MRWVTPIPPDRDGGGGHIRQAHLLLALAEDRPVDLVVAGAVTDPAVRAAMATVTEVAPLAVDHARSLRRRVRDVRLATLARYHREVSLHAAVRRAIADRWDELPPAAVVNVELPALAPLVALRRDEHWLLTMHNVRSGMAPQHAGLAAGRRRWLFDRDTALAHRFERWAPTAFDAVVVPSAEDATRLGVDCEIVPNGVDLDRFRPSPLPPAPRLLFAGALYTGPNIDGARWLAEAILPLVRAEVPAATLEVVGLDPAPEVRALARLRGVAVHADVASVVPHLSAARVACVPLRIGTGTRLKALEAMAAARPVIGTTVGLEGLGIVDGRDALVRDDTAAFAAGIVELLTDDGRAATVVAGGRELAAAFDWAAIGRRFREVVADAAAGAGAR